MRARKAQVRRVLDKSEVEALMAVPNVRCRIGLRIRAMMELMYRAGLGPGEVCALRPADIRWESMVLEVRRSRGVARRPVPIDGGTLGWLEAWDKKRPKGAERFLCTLKGTATSMRYLQQVVGRMARRAGLARAQQVTPIVLRHTYAAELLDEGFTLEEVQTLLGHATIASTQVYTRIDPNDLAKRLRIRERHAADTPGFTHLAGALLALPQEVRVSLCQAILSAESQTAVQGKRSPEDPSTGVAPELRGAILEESVREGYQRGSSDQRFRMSQLFRDYMASDKWKRVQEEVKTRAATICMDCKRIVRKGGTAHHTSYQNWGSGGPREVMDCVWLCSRCHRIRHGRSKSHHHYIEVPFFAKRDLNNVLDLDLWDLLRRRVQTRP